MKDFIRDVIARFGGRAPASDQEKQAQLYFKNILEGYCTRVSTHQFSVPVKSMFQSLKFFCTLFYLSLFLFHAYPAVAFFLSLANTILYLGHFVTYHFWLDFLFPKSNSLNVIGDVEPQRTATSTVIVSGHMDSTQEFIWWYRLKHAGMVLSVISGFLIALFPITAGLGLLHHLGFLPIPVGDYLWWANVITSPITIVLFNIHGEEIIEGAQDNLSGITIANAVAKHFSEQKLKQTRVRVISFGCEEPGLRGSTAYARDFKGTLALEKAVCINVDGVKDADKLTIITAEPMVLAKYNSFMIDKLERAFKGQAIPYVKKLIPVGATDGVSFLRNGIPAVSIIGQSTEKLDPTYHTRLDTPNCVEERSLELTKMAVIRFIENWDKEEHPMN